MAQVFRRTYMRISPKSTSMSSVCYEGARCRLPCLAIQVLLLCPTELTAALLREVLDIREAAAATAVRTGARPTPPPATPGHAPAASFRHSQSCGQLEGDDYGSTGEWGRHGVGPSTFPGCEGAARPPGAGQLEQAPAALHQELEELRVSPGTKTLYGSILCLCHQIFAGTLQLYCAALALPPSFNACHHQGTTSKARCNARSLCTALTLVWLPCPPVNP